MKNLILAGLASLMAVAPAFAQVKSGEYKGVTADGSACSFEVSGVSFVDNVKHPLNERVEVVSNGLAFMLAHAPRIDVEALEIHFDHDQLTGAKGAKGLAYAMIVRMDHSEGKDGPTEFTLIQRDYKNAANTVKTVCRNLIAPE